MAARAALVALFFIALLAGCGSPGPRASTPRATIHWTSYGVPHVVAHDWVGLGYGAGYAQARDNLCVMAEGYVTARGERSLYFGPEAEYSLGGVNYHVNNLQSDLLLALYDQDPALMTKSALSPQLKDLAEGYAQGYDRWIAEAPGSGMAKACLGQPWLKPITATDVLRRVDHIKLLAGSLALSGAIVKAAPPGSVMDEAARLALPSHLPVDREDLGFGSNGYAFGSDMTGTDTGLLVGNPHWVWDGVNRFNQMQLTIPGEVDVAGAGLLGFPGPLVGFNEGVAWTITVSTAQRFSLHELSLAPGDPLTYMVDGQARHIEPRDVTVQARMADGTVAPITHRFYLSDFGPLFSLDLAPSTARNAVDNLDETGRLPIARTPDVAGLDWTPASAYAVNDVAAHDDRLPQTLYDEWTAPDLDHFEAGLRKDVGWTIVNTIAAGRDGRAFIGDMGVVPHITNAQIDDCNTTTGKALFAAASIPILDASRSACAPGSDPDAPQAGIFGPGNLPQATRSDYLMNSNDSHWLPNAHEKLQGYSALFGAEATERTLRTRMGLQLWEERAAGHLPCDIDARVDCSKVTPARIQHDIYDEGPILLARQELDGALETMCTPVPALAHGQAVDLGDACRVLRAWDRRSAGDGRGLSLWEHWMTLLLGPDGTPGGTRLSWKIPFDAADPVATPSGWDASDPRVRDALAAAVLDLRDAGIPLDASISESRVVGRNGELIPVQGAASGGSPNLMIFPWVPGHGWGDGALHGNSYVQIVTWDEGGPRAQTIVAQSQGTDPDSPHFADQTRLYSEHGWVRFPFRAAEISADRSLVTQELG